VTDAPELAPLEFGWDRVVGQASTSGALRRATQGNRPHPAYLLLGPAGLGKALLACTVAAALVCDEDEGRRPCGECGSCRKVAARTHADVWTEVPTGRSHTITVDQISSVQRRLGFRRLEGRHRVVLFLGAETMNEHAQNKLLKTLEEPPEGTVVVLTALHPGQMLQTVRSRCQKLALGAVPVGELAAWLVREHGADPGAAEVAAAASGGLPRRAIQLLEPEQAAARSQQVLSIADALEGSTDAARALLKDLDRDREGAREAVSLMQELLRDAMTTALGADVGRIHPDVTPASSLVELGPERLGALMLRVERVQNRLGRNVHPGSVLKDFLRDVGTSS